MNIKRLLNHIKEKNVTAKCLNWCHLEKITLISPSLSTCLFPPTDPLQKQKILLRNACSLLFQNRSTSVISFIYYCLWKNKHHLNLFTICNPPPPPLYSFPIRYGEKNGTRSIRLQDPVGVGGLLHFHTFSCVCS